MKKQLFVVCAILSLISVRGLAQKSDGDNLGEITFEELKDKEKSSQYFAVGGGFNGNFLMVDAAKINANLPAPFHIKDVSSPLFISGGQGFITFFFKNVRFGFSAGIGTQSLENVVGTGDTAMKQHVDFSSSFNGLTIDYAIPVFKGFTILPGIQGGVGNLVFERYDGLAADKWQNVSSTSLKPMSRIEVSQMYLQPMLNFEYAITTFTMIRANVGYAMTFHGDTWTLNRTTELSPNGSSNPSDLKASGLVAGFGVFFGLFRNE